MRSSAIFAAFALQTVHFVAATPLAFDDVTLIGRDGRATVMKEAEYNQLKTRHQPAHKAAPQLVSRQADSSAGLSQRCEESSETQIISDTTFNNWDVAMSPIISAQGGGATVEVTEGYSIANNLKIVTGGVLKTVAKTIMGDAYPDIDTDTTWTTTQTSSIEYTVPEGQFGLIVVQPLVRRIEGNLFSGCTDAPTSTPFTVDSYFSQSYGDLSWVQGVIRLCNSSTYPIPYCNGEGSHE